MCLLPRHPRGPTPPAKEGDLYLAPRCFKSFRVSHQPDLSPSPPQALPPPSSAQEVGWPWGFSLCRPHQPAATWAAGVRSQGRSRALGRWLWTQQWRDPERVRCSPMSQPGDCPPPAPVCFPGDLGAPSPVLPPAPGLEVKVMGQLSALTEMSQEILPELPAPSSAGPQPYLEIPQG